MGGGVRGGGVRGGGVRGGGVRGGWVESANLCYCFAKSVNPPESRTSLFAKQTGTVS